MSELLDKIQRVTEDLHALEQEFTSLADRNFGSAEAQEKLDELLHDEVLQQFKRTTESVRKVLWAYIEYVSNHRAVPGNLALQRLRMRRLVDLLQGLQDRSSRLGYQGSFLGEIQQVACRITDERTSHNSFQQKFARAMLVEKDLSSSN